jgi:hypothetical protein
MDSQQKLELNKVFGAAATSSYVSNLLLGNLVCIILFKISRTAVTLNWVNYRSGTGEAEPAAGGSDI